MKRNNVKFSILFMCVVMIGILLFPNQTFAAVRLNATKKTVVIGSTYQLKIYGTSRKVRWTSSNKKVAKVSSSGKVTALKSGTVTIRAKVGSKKYICKVTVITQQKAYISTMYTLINKERRKYGRASYDKNTYLQSAAQLRAKEIASKFSHTRPNGNAWTSAISLRYDYIAKKGVSEVIACDFATPQKAVTAFMNNSNNKADLISKTYHDVGVGVYLADDGYLYWVVIVGRRK